MTLCVSLRVPDGVVLAVDSLATMTGRLKIAQDIEGPCPECGKPIKLHSEAAGIPIPSSISDTALKMRGFGDKLGVTMFGSNFLHGKTVYRQIRDFEVKASGGLGSCAAKDLAEALASHLDGEWTAEGHDLKSVPDNYAAVGLQVSGFDNADEVAGHTYVVSIGKPTRVEHFTEFGCTVSGDRRVVVKLWKADEAGMEVPQPAWNALGLQDAIDYAEFLIRTTADYQRFAPMIPTVGGSIDVGLVTQYRGFQWIRRKLLSELLERGKPHDHSGNAHD